jgi:hypothetical protein
VEVELPEAGGGNAVEGLTVSPSREVHELSFGSLDDARSGTGHGWRVADAACC